MYFAKKNLIGVFQRDELKNITVWYDASCRGYENVYAACGWVERDGGAGMSEKNAEGLDRWWNQEPSDGFKKQVITWQVGKPTPNEVSYTKK